MASDVLLLVALVIDEIVLVRTEVSVISLRRDPRAPGTEEAAGVGEAARGSQRRRGGVAAEAQYDGVVQL